MHLFFRFQCTVCIPHIQYCTVCTIHNLYSTEMIRRPRALDGWRLGERTGCGRVQVYYHSVRTVLLYHLEKKSFSLVGVSFFRAFSSFLYHVCFSSSPPIKKAYWVPFQVLNKDLSTRACTVQHIRTYSIYYVVCTYIHTYSTAHQPPSPERKRKRKRKRRKRKRKDRKRKRKKKEKKTSHFINHRFPPHSANTVPYPTPTHTYASTTGTQSLPPSPLPTHQIRKVRFRNPNATLHPGPTTSLPGKHSHGRTTAPPQYHVM